MDKYITHQRFDLIAKYLYLKYNNYEFYQELYQKHIITFNQGWEHPGNKTKIEDFIQSFEKLIESMKKFGYIDKKPIEIGKNGFIISGAHRLITSYFLNMTPKFKLSDKNGCETYHYDFFLNRNNYWKRKEEQYQNLDQIYADTMALEYLNIKSKIRPIIFYPVSYSKFNKQEVENLLNKYGNIYYFKKIKYNKCQLKNFIKELYRGESWIGGLFPNESCGGKLDVCYEDNYTQMYLFEFNDLKQMIGMKQELRNLFKLEKNSVHIPDTEEESFRIAVGFLNQNSLQFYNKDLNQKEKSILQKLFKLPKSDKLCWDLKENKIVNNLEIINNPKKYYYVNGYKIKNYLVFDSILKFF